jgi:penicillin-binding protein 1C
LKTRSKKIIFCVGAMVWLALMLVAVPVALSPRPSLTGDTPFSTAWYDRSGTLLRLSLAADDRYRLRTPLENLSPALLAATLRQEDRYFYLHPGVNPVSLARAAFETYILRTRPVGGSTITMQLVRLRDNLDTRTVSGKITQAYRALQIERHYAKPDILEAYLNLAPYGGNIHGAGTAARIYFGQDARILSTPQAIALAVIPQNPVKRSPLNIDHAAWDHARLRLAALMPAALRPEGDLMNLPLAALRREDLPSRAPHLIDGLPAPGDGGAIHTTIDYPLQKTIETRLSAWMRHERTRNLGNGAAMLVHIPTMQIRALVGSADFNDTRAQGQVDGTAALRSPGSTLKPFVYALALEQGLIHPETLLDDDPTYFAEYRPGNFDKRFIGKIPAREALSLSRNVPAIALAARLDRPDLYTFLKDTGVRMPHARKHYGLSLVAGGAEITMRDLVQLYAMLANGGMLRDPVYTSAQTPSRPRPILSPEAALLTLTMIENRDPDALPFAAAPDVLPVYWKTGTSNGFRDAWTVGVFGDYVLAVWLGHFDGRPSPALVGRDAAAPLFFDLMRAVTTREKMQDRVKPALAALNLSRVAICRRTGAPETCGDQYDGWFIPGKSPFALPAAKTAPEILSPRGGIAYVNSRRSAEPLRIPLEAKSTKGETLYWFAGNRFLGTARAGTPLFWTPTPGHHTVRFVDGEGRGASQSISVTNAD